VSAARFGVVTGDDIKSPAALEATGLGRALTGERGAKHRR